MANSDHQRQQLRVGIFFDGTSNNHFNSGEGQVRLAQGLAVDSGSSYAVEPSNIAHLQAMYAQRLTPDAHGQSITSLYVSGIGTTTGEGDRAFPAQTYGRGETGVLGKAAEAQAQLLELLAQWLATLAQGSPSVLQLDLFGYSRGAAAARHFANQIRHVAFPRLFNLPADFRCEIEFIGLYDCVAAMGGLRDLGDTADAINPGLNLYLAEDCARQVIHLTARDEQRHNFSLNHTAPQWPLEIALPGVHGDLGGGYPQQMQEHVALTRWQSNRVSRSTPVKQTQAWKLTEAQLPQWQDRDLLDPEDPNASLEVRVVSQPEGSREDPMQRVMASVYMQRRVLGHLSRVYLRLMHTLASEHGVPFTPWREQDETRLPAELLPIQARLLAHVHGQPLALSAAEERLLRQRYIHCSANWEASVGKGGGVLDKAYFNAPHPGGRQRFAQQPVED